jgi:hypothetical protein
VPGWDATRVDYLTPLYYRDTKVGERVVDSYVVHTCPLFIADPQPVDKESRLAIVHQNHYYELQRARAEALEEPT